MRVAVVGTGVAGLVAASVLDQEHDVLLLEADRRVGGHTNTVDVEVEGVHHAVDTGFIVCNELTYPRFLAMLDHLDVATRPSDMSFSVRDEVSGLEWRGTSASSVFAQRRNLLRPSFLRMLRDVVAFNRVARAVAAADDPDERRTLAELVRDHGWGAQLLHGYLVPLGASIWSADPDRFADIPVRTFARFFEHHGLLQLGGQPRWRTVVGGSRSYVDALLDRFGGEVRTGCAVEKVVRRAGDGVVEVRTAAGELLELDHVVLATHSDQALELLGDPSAAEAEVLGAIRYQPNDAVLHTDERLLPRSPRARASWNHHQTGAGNGRVAVTYDMNRLQGIESARPLLVTLNRTDDIDPALVLGRWEYHHPVFDQAAIAAQARHAEISTGLTSYAGAYWGYGFHEDGVRSALRACEGLGVVPPW